MSLGAAAIYGGGALASAAGNIWGGGQADPQDAGDLHLVNSGQLDLYNSMLRGVQSGAGDFGAGAGIKQGKSQLAQFMNDRGINPNGGAGIGAYANMVGQAEAGANENRLGYAMDLLRSPLQTAQTAGSNWISSSPSQGYDASGQWKGYQRNQHQYLSQYGGAYGRPVDRDAQAAAAQGPGPLTGSGGDASSSLLGRFGSGRGWGR